jgi:hypothetical protein
MSGSDVEDKPLMLLVRLIQMGTQAEYRKDAGDAAWGNALKIAGVPPRMPTMSCSQGRQFGSTGAPGPMRSSGDDRPFRAAVGDLNSGQRFHHGQKFLTPVALRTGEVEELLQPGHDRSPLGGSCHHDGPSTAQFDQPLISKHAQGPQHGVGVDAEHRDQILGLRDPVAGAGLAVGDGPADLGRHLIVKRHGVRSIHAGQHQTLGIRGFRRLDRTHNDNDSSVTVTVEEGTPPVPSHGGPDPYRPTDADLLFKEARRRERRQRLAWAGVVIIVVGAVATVVAFAVSRPGPALPPAATATPIRPGPTSPPPDSIVPLTRAGPLGVGPAGAMYVSDVSRHQVLVRLTDGQFQVVAGDGRDGFAGDGGPATKAELSQVSDMAFAPNGDLYLADGGRVRVVDRAGTVRTIAGDGRSSGPNDSIATGTPALSAPLGPTVSLAFSPSGQLYVATETQLFRLSAAGRLDILQAVLSPGSMQMAGALNSFGSIAVDGQGNVYASSLFDGWSVFKISPSGHLPGLCPAKWRQHRRGPAGGERRHRCRDGEYVLHVRGDHPVNSFAVTRVSGIDSFLFTDFFSVAPDGAFFADNLGPPAFERFQQIISVTDGRGTSLWRGASRP